MDKKTINKNIKKITQKEFEQKIQQEEMYVEAGNDLMMREFQDITFNQIDLSEINFSGINLSGVIFYKCDLHDVDFKNAVFENRYKKSTVFNYCNLNGADFSGVELCERSSFVQSSMIKAKLANSIMSYCNFRHAVLAESDMSNGVFSGSEFGYANMSNANCIRCNFYNAFLNETDMKYAKLEYANLQEATLTSDLSYADLNHANLSNSYIFGNTADYACFDGAFFTNAMVFKLDSYVGATFVGANLLWIKDEEAYQILKDPIFDNAIK